MVEEGLNFNLFDNLLDNIIFFNHAFIDFFKGENHTSFFMFGYFNFAKFTFT
jgi:hypothetical protein